LGYYQKAIDDLSEGLATKPDDPLAMTKRGQAYEALAQNSQALDDFRGALSSHPELEAAKEGLARIMAQQQQSDDKGEEPLRNP